MKKTQGFTIIELMLSITFVALLLLATVAISVAAAKIYSKGLTLRSLAATSRTIDDEILRDISSTSPFPVSGTTSQFFEVVAANGVQDSGRFCTGGVSYVWNTPTSSASSQIMYDDGSSVGFARFFDPGATLCQKTSNKYPVPKKVAAKELLSDLRLYEFKITQTQATTNGQALYSITYTLGTADVGSLSIQKNQATGTVEYGCSVGKNTSNDAFCGVSSFTTVARAGNLAGVR